MPTPAPSLPPEIHVSPSVLKLTEAAGSGRSALVEVWLSNRPSDDVWVDVSSVRGRLAVSGAFVKDDGRTLVGPFTDDNWRSRKAFTATVVSDDFARWSLGDVDHSKR
jgi:hypothetical protein